MALCAPLSICYTALGPSNVFGSVFRSVFADDPGQMLYMLSR